MTVLRSHGHSFHIHNQSILAKAHLFFPPEECLYKHHHCLLVDKHCVLSKLEWMPLPSVVFRIILHLFFSVLDSPDNSCQHALAFLMSRGFSKFSFPSCIQFAACLPLQSSTHQLRVMRQHKLQERSYRVHIT